MNVAEPMLLCPLPAEQRASNPRLASIHLIRPTCREGERLLCKIVLDSPAQDGGDEVRIDYSIPFTLRSIFDPALPAEVIVPEHVTIQPGESSATFFIEVVGVKRDTKLRIMARKGEDRVEATIRLLAMGRSCCW